MTRNYMHEIHGYTYSSSFRRFVESRQRDLYIQLRNSGVSELEALYFLLPFAYTLRSAWEDKQVS
jgi:hypothetical protein